jgi:excisionase family DNA binding protein
MPKHSVGHRLDLEDFGTYTQLVRRYVILFTDKRGAAKMVGLSPKTIERLIQRGELPAFKPAGKVRIRCEDIFSWLESVRMNPSVHEI